MRQVGAQTCTQLFAIGNVVGVYALMNAMSVSRVQVVEENNSLLLSRDEFLHDGFAHQIRWQ